jgi:hypothetical protein
VGVGPGVPAPPVVPPPPQAASNRQAEMKATGRTALRPAATANFIIDPNDPSLCRGITAWRPSLVVISKQFTKSARSTRYTDGKLSRNDCS